MAGELIFECEVCKGRVPCNTIVPEGWIKLTSHHEGRIKSIHTCSGKCLTEIVSKIYGIIKIPKTSVVPTSQRTEITKTYNSDRPADWDIEQDQFLLNLPKNWPHKIIIKSYNEKYGYLNRVDWGIINRMKELLKEKQESQPIILEEESHSSFTDKAIIRSLEVIEENEIKKRRYHNNIGNCSCSQYYKRKNRYRRIQQR